MAFVAAAKLAVTNNSVSKALAEKDFDSHMY